jgi:ADP-ribose pyrophosphatase YjhB (NUDIX family)
MDARPIQHQQPPRFAVGGVLYRYSASGNLEIVLIKKQGGSWTLPKGQIEADETIRAALIREMVEEVALSGSVETLLSTVAYPIKKRGQVRQKVVQYYLMRVRSGTPRPNRREGIRQARWFTVPVALQRVQNERVHEIIEQAIVHLNQHA